MASTRARYFVFLPALLVYAACVGEDPPFTESTPPIDAGTSETGVPNVSPDAAPSLGCPDGCLPPAPAGWTGPSAVFDGPSSEKPTACPADKYTLEEVMNGHQGITADPATCECGTPQLAGTSCTGTYNIIPPGKACDEANATTTFQIAIPSTTTCFAISPADSSIGRVNLTLNRGTCSFPNAKTVLPPPAFAKSNVACGLRQLAECGGKPTCITTPPPDAPFTRICIHKAGDEPCPSLDYAARFVSHTGFKEGRSCSPCTGQTKGGSCTIAHKFGTTAQCGGTVRTFTTNICANINAADTGLDVSGFAPKDVTCTASGGAPLGIVADEAPVTFCCNK